MLEKTQLVLFERCNNTAAFDVVNMDGSLLEEKSPFKMLVLSFSSKLDWDPYIVYIAKTASKKIEALIGIWRTAWCFVTIRRCYKDVYVNNFFPRTARVWNYLPIECFPLTYDLNDFN